MEADGRNGALEQDYVPEVDRPRTQEEQDTPGREEDKKQGLTDSKCVGKVNSANFAPRGFSEVCGPQRTAPRPKCSWVVRCRPSSGTARGLLIVGAPSTVCFVQTSRNRKTLIDHYDAKLRASS